MKEIILRECACKNSKLGGQGFQYCNCRSDCNSCRSKCKKSKTLLTTNVSIVPHANINNLLNVYIVFVM